MLFPRPRAGLGEEPQHSKDFTSVPGSPGLPWLLSSTVDSLTIGWRDQLQPGISPATYYELSYYQ